MNRKTNLENYDIFLRTLKSKNYDFVFFDELDNKHNQVIIRHDIDFDVMAALEIAEIEYSMGVKSTFFFLLRNESYNPFEPNNFEAIQKIKKLGHMVTIHFDPIIYEDFEKGFFMEKQLFESAFETSVEIISLHRPNEYFQNHNQPIDQCEHTYMNKYFRDIKYVSDSTGIFRHGHPFSTNEFHNNESLHILIHPIWWIYNGESNFDKLKSFYFKKKESLKNHYSLNCIPFKTIIHELD
jgi:hypothetical protein